MRRLLVSATEGGAYPADRAFKGLLIGRITQSDLFDSSREGWGQGKV